MKNLSRRKFIGSVAGVAACSLAFPYYIKGGLSTARPNSKVGGVQLGVTTYSYRSMSRNAEDVVQYLLMAGVNSIELRSVAEESLGIPPLPARPAAGTVLTAPEKADYDRALSMAIEARRLWRLSLDMQKYADLRKLFNDAGIDIHIAKFAPSSWSDEEIDYAFDAAAILGSVGISDELSEASARRLGQFAEKHKSLSILHTHSQPAQPGFTFEKFLDYSPANMLSFDVGHYVGATGLHPNIVLESLHHRISNIHIKDKTGPAGNPPATEMPFGRGDVPIADILLLIKKEKWPIHVDVEMEYDVPEGSNAALEVAKCIDYMRNILE